MSTILTAAFLGLISMYIFSQGVLIAVIPVVTAFMGLLFMVAVILYEGFE